MQQDRVPSNAMTLGELFNLYMTERRHRLSEGSRVHYTRAVDRHLSDWKQRAVETIGPDAVVAKFNSIRSPAQANLTFKLVRALMRYGMSMRNDDGTPAVASNAVDVLGQRRLWHTLRKRRDVVGLHELPAWWSAVKSLPDGVESRDEGGKSLKAMRRPSTATRKPWRTFSGSFC